MNWSEDTLIGRLEAGDVVGVKEEIELVVAKKLDDRIQLKAQEIRDRFNTKEEK